MLEFYKEPGITPLEFINTIKKLYPDTKICYTARLDPMARGKIPVLFGDECKNMHNYTNLSKTYEVKVMIGYKTDSDDVLGILEPQDNSLDTKTVSTLSLHDIISNYRTYFEVEKEITIRQKYHYFSTKALLDRSKNKDTETSHDVTLFSSKIIDSGELDFTEWMKECISIIDKVDKTKDFRQKEIIEQWQNIKNTNMKIPYITLQLYVGSGFFVRQFIRDSSDTIGIPLMCYDIHRISIDYKL